VKNVWILRHGKAASKSSDGDDHSRPLTGRGRRQSTEVAAFLADQVASGAAPAPDLVLSSTAARARATAEPVHAVLGADVALELERALYGADPDDIIDRLRLLPETVGTVMVVGHNPTFHELALLLLSSEDTDGRHRLEAGFPTAALALVALDITAWPAAAARSGHLEELFLPTR
jgi:phosphohistidine phosphatase